MLRAHQMNGLANKFSGFKLYIWSWFIPFFCYPYKISWDLADDFSLASNPNGQWAYGTRVGTSFTLGIPGTIGSAILENPETYKVAGIPPGKIAMNFNYQTRHTAKYLFSVETGGSTVSNRNALAIQQC